MATPQELANNARCFFCFGDITLQQMQTYMYAFAAGNTNVNSLTALAKCMKCLSVSTLLEIKSYLIAVINGGSTDINALADAAKCYECIPPGAIEAVNTYLLTLDPNSPGITNPSQLAQAAKSFDLGASTLLEIQVYLLALAAGVSTDPNTLASLAKCFKCLNVPVLRDVQTYLTETIIANGGSVLTGHGGTPALDCGTIQNSILVSGAGDALANGLYTAPSPGTWTNANGYYITWVFGTIISGNLYNSSGTLLYTIPANFPCGTWTVAPGAPGGSAPAPQQAIYALPTYMTDGLISFWRFDESAGNRLDTLATAGNWQPNIGTYARPQGIVDYAAQLPNVNGGFINSKTTPYNVGAGNSFTVAGWYNFQTDPNAGAIFAKWHNAIDAQRDYVLTATAAFANPQLKVRTLTNAEVTVSAVASLAANTWHFIAFGFDNAAQQIWISVDNGARVTQACTSVRSTVAQPTIGVFNGTAAGLTMMVDSTAFWNKSIVADQIIALWNNGQGWDYPFDVSRSAQVANNWSARVVTNGAAAPSNNTLSAVTSFVQALISGAIWVKYRWMGIFAPDSLTATLTPLVRGLGSDPWTQANFVAGDLTVNGLLGAATKVINTNCQPLPVGGNGLVGFSVYNYTSSAGSEFEMGSSDNTVNNGYMIGISFTNNALFNAPYAAGAGTVSAANAGWTGYLSGNRISTTDARLYRANSSNAHAQLGSTNVNNVAAATNTFTTTVMCFNFSGATQQYTTKRISYAAYHDGFTQAQSLIEYNAVQALRTAFGGGFI